MVDGIERMETATKFEDSTVGFGSFNCFVLVVKNVCCGFVAVVNGR